MEDLITHSAVLFDDRTPATISPPLPPAPAGEAAPSYGYGSSHTKVASVPAPLQTLVRQTQAQQPQSSEDFTPRMPARPANSIHPSSRNNPTSPTKITMDVPPPLPARPGRASERSSPTKQHAPMTPTNTSQTKAPTSKPGNALPQMASASPEKASPLPDGSATLTMDPSTPPSSKTSINTKPDSLPPSPSQSFTNLRAPKSLASSLPSIDTDMSGVPKNSGTEEEIPPISGGFSS